LDSITQPLEGVVSSRVGVRGHIHLVFESAALAGEAIKSLINKVELGGHTLQRVSYSYQNQVHSRTVSPTNILKLRPLPESFSDSDLTEVLNSVKAKGVKNVYVVNYVNGDTTRKQAYVEFASVEDANAVLRLSGAKALFVNGGRVHAWFMPRIPSHILGPVEPCDVIYIRGFRGNEADLRSLFSGHAEHIRRFDFTDKGKKRLSIVEGFRRVRVCRKGDRGSAGH